FHRMHGEPRPRVIMRAGPKANSGDRNETVARIGRDPVDVFDDIGLSDRQAQQAKSELVVEISTIIERRGLTQAQAAEILGVSHPKVSALLRGRLDGFSTDRLFRFLNALGNDIEITVKPRPRSGRQASIRVTKSRTLRAAPLTKAAS